METFLNILISGILLGGIYSLVSIGLNLIFGVVRIVNFAQGEFVMIAMYATFFCFAKFGIGPYYAVFLVAPLLFVLGIVVQRLVLQPLQNEPMMQVFATFGLLILFENSVLAITRGEGYSLAGTYSSTVIDVFGLPQPHHIKMDVDGGELAVLEGATRTLSSPALQSMLVEVQTSLSGAVTEVLERHGLRLHEKVSVKNKAGEWVNVPVIEGSFIVNIGDLMQQWTNDQWTSTMHRVINPATDSEENKDRLSIVFFHQPNYDAMVECLPSCQSAGEPAKYDPISSGDHLLSKFVKQPTFGKGA